VIRDFAPRVIRDFAPRVIRDIAPRVIRDFAPRVIRDFASQPYPCPPSRAGTGTTTHFGRQKWGGRIRGREDEGEAGGVEHARLGIDGFAEVLGADKWMVAAFFSNDAVNVKAVSRNQTTDIFGSEEEDALDAILLLGLEGKTALAFEEGAGGPGGTPEDAGGIGGGGHGVEVLVEFGGVDFLGFVNGEEQVGGGTHDLGGGVAGKELEASLAKRVDVAFGGMPAATSADTGIERMTDAIHVVGRLGFEGG
jgi:hypothetical protein